MFRYDLSDSGNSNNNYDINNYIATVRNNDNDNCGECDNAFNCFKIECIFT